MTLHDHYKKHKIPYIYSKAWSQFLYTNTLCGMNTNTELLYFTLNLEDPYTSRITSAILT